MQDVTCMPKTFCMQDVYSVCERVFKCKMLQCMPKAFCMQDVSVDSVCQRLCTQDVTVRVKDFLNAGCYSACQSLFKC